MKNRPSSSQLSVMAAADLSEYQVGRRCVCEGYTGTILYVGKVPPTEGVWLGVEWDDVSRGKHSGDHEGVHYFTCRREGTGSFVRPRKISLGLTFIDAVRERYGGSEGEERELYVDVKPVEMVGTDMITRKQSQYDKLHHISLREMYVSSAGNENKIKATTPRVRILNLSCTPLLPSWEVVASIAAQLPLLVSLDLSENKLLKLPAVPSQLEASFASLTALYLNKMELQWKDVGVVLSMLPRLQDLHACQNKISDLLCEAGESSSKFPESLQLLNLEENQLAEWSEITKLKHLTKLKTLILNDNKLTCISHSREQEVGLPGHLEGKDGCYFPALQCLSINNNSINDWESLNVLNDLPSLTELKFKGNPLTSGELSLMARQMVIARIGRLTLLNSSLVSVRERQLAERQYLKEHAQEWVESEADKGKRRSFNQRHPRYSKLVKDQGLPEDALHVSKPTTSALKHGLISITIRCPDQPSSQPAKDLTKKLPGTMTVQKLKGLLQRLYKVDTAEQKLTYLDERGDHEIEMDDDLKQLSFYSISSGDTILLRW